MADLIVTFGRIAGPVMSGHNIRTERIAIAAPATDPAVGQMVCNGGGFHGENVADLLAEGDCWVSIGSNAQAEDPVSGTSGSFKMVTGERVQRSIENGDFVSVVIDA